MNKYFTEEYIELCKDKKIQELKEQLDEDSLIKSECELIRKINPDYIPQRNDFIWIPTGDEVEEEILKRCKEKEWYYEFSLGYDKQLYAVLYKDYSEQPLLIEASFNPLTAKIKLLISLLEAK